ncbi:site-specific integrase [Caldicellulosiruptor acetigenus]|uniref:tyrosine-type recombinase/integrase n=1 Tax=Caldicellulosiruptor acetigenus TaxID=301953 RepID=UPI0022A99DF8|nr:tyrosine-type recombinase/integrase [Caldicellulosiruptor acetigenus]WAM36524.1 site-specific integrase [Caldicellulosiruptor acetigenus]
MRGHIAKKGKKYYIVVDIGIVDGKRKQKWLGGFDTKAEAEEALPGILNIIYQNKNKLLERKTFGELLDLWLNTVAKNRVSLSTFQSYSSSIALHIKPFLGDYELSKLTPMDLQKYYQHIMTEKGLSSTLALYHHRIIHQALDYAVKMDMLEKNPADYVDPPRKRSYQPSIWDEKTAKKALEIFKETNIRIPVLLAIYTGMRIGEIAALKWDDIHLEQGYITVNKTLMKINGQTYIKEKAENKNSYRIVAISNQVVEELKEWKAKQEKLKKELKELYHDEGFVCTFEDGRVQDPKYITKVFQKTIEKHGLPKIRFHDLRHTHASLLLKHGIDPKHISDRLGHSTITTTLNIYSHVFDEKRRKVAETFEDILNNQQK